VIAYVDSSVILRFVLKQAETLPEWPDIDEAVTSELTVVECLRTVDRLRLTGHLDTARAERAFREIDAILARMLHLRLNADVLRLAKESVGVPLGTLDALHFATARMHREITRSLVLATHDRELADATRALGFATLGA
jgi:predicted nucleic acid-binding protein